MTKMWFPQCFMSCLIFKRMIPLEEGADIQLATVCGVEWNVYTAAFTPPQNGAIVRTDSVRTKAYLQNSETCMRNLHW